LQSTASALKNPTLNNGVNMGIKLDLTIADTNTILNALGKQPFEQVAQVVGKIQQQGGPQAKEVEEEEKAAAEAESRKASAS
jgi:hypothetical protein